MTNQILDSEVNVPRWLHELHGERTRVSTLVLVYLSGILCAALITGLLFQGGATIWQMAVSALVFMDVGGGLVANFSESTSQYYQKHSRLRVPFIALHVLQPVLLALAFPLSLFYFIYVMVFALGAAFAINAIRNDEIQRTLAALLVAAGCGFAFVFHPTIPALYLFAPLFMVKLILGFAVRRHIDK